MDRLGARGSAPNPIHRALPPSPPIDVLAQPSSGRKERLIRFAKDNY
jgi:hypothetical protein